MENSACSKSGDRPKRGHQGVEMMQLLLNLRNKPESRKFTKSNAREVISFAKNRIKRSQQPRTDPERTEMDSQLFQNHGYQNMACFAVFTDQAGCPYPCCSMLLTAQRGESGRGEESDDQLLTAFERVVNESDCLHCRSNSTLRDVTGPSRQAMQP